MTYTETEIVKMLETSDYAVERAVLALYDRQTMSEQDSEDTRDKNGIGFSAIDAEIFSSFAKQILASKNPNGKRLSPKQLAICRKPGNKTGKMKIARYARQLVEIANTRTNRSAA